MNATIVWVMGGPSSGKSTMSQNIVDKYVYKLLSSSALVEREARFDLTLSRVLNLLQSVKRVTKFLLLESEIMSNRGSLRGFVIDGYPQNQSDATILKKSIGVPDFDLHEKC